jgi:hypothetical protein
MLSSLVTETRSLAESQPRCGRGAVRAKSVGARLLHSQVSRHEPPLQPRRGGSPAWRRRDGTARQPFADDTTRRKFDALSVQRARAERLVRNAACAGSRKYSTRASPAGAGCARSAQLRAWRGPCRPSTQPASAVGCGCGAGAWPLNQGRWSAKGRLRPVGRIYSCHQRQPIGQRPTAELKSFIRMWHSSCFDDGTSGQATRKDCPGVAVADARLFHSSGGRENETVVRPAWARSWRWKSSRKLATANEVKRNCTRATECGEEAWSETASRWTRTRYEAQPSRASGQRSAKLSWPRLRRRKSGGCAGKDRVLTWGDLASWLKGRRGNAERGVSRGHSSCLRGVKGRTRRKADNHVSWTCSASAAWATGANRKRAG